MARIKKRQRKKNSKKLAEKYWKEWETVMLSFMDNTAPLLTVTLPVPLHKIGMHLVREVKEEE